MNSIKSKITSRKFLLALIGTLIGILIALSDVGGNAGLICGAAASIISIVSYQITESSIDKAQIEEKKTSSEKIMKEFIEEFVKNKN